MLFHEGKVSCAEISTRLYSLMKEVVTSRNALVMLNREAANTGEAKQT